MCPLIFALLVMISFHGPSRHGHSRGLVRNSIGMFIGNLSIGTFQSYVSPLAHVHVLANVMSCVCAWLRYALTICVCVCARGSPGHVIFGAFDIITFDTTTLRV